MSHCSNSASLGAASQGHVTQSRFQDHYGAFSGMLLSPGTRAFTPWCFACARGNLSARALPAGTGAEHVAIGTFSCHEPIFFPMPGEALRELVPFQHTSGCSKVWALLLCVRQVTSPVLTCGLVCREEGCC